MIPTRQVNRHTACNDRNDSRQDVKVEEPGVHSRNPPRRALATICSAMAARIQIPVLIASPKENVTVGELVASEAVGVMKFVDQRVVEAVGGVRGYPTSVLIGRDGTVRHTVIGPIGPITLEPALRRALADTAR